MHWADPSVITTVIIAAVTLLYTLLTGLIWHATWQNTKATREVLEASHRPYVGIVNVNLGGQIGETNVIVSVSNVGSVPSRDVEMNMELCAGPNKRSIRGFENSIVLFTGQTFSASLTLTDEELPYQGTGFHIEVTVRYKGVTDKEYTTRCTYTYRDPLEAFVISAGRFD
jgi:hypothetical protein